jgi:GNAT superfamily N-acetyltransferase
VVTHEDLHGVARIRAVFDALVEGLIAYRTPARRAAAALSSGEGELEDFRWAPILPPDWGAIAAIAALIHPDLPERPEVFDERRNLFPEGCQALVATSGAIAGYGIAYPWTLHSVPTLDAFIGRLPDKPDCLYVHDVAILPEARGRRGAERYIELIRAAARTARIARLACVSVYGTDAMWRKYGFSVDPSPAVAAKMQSYGESAKYMTADVDAGPLTSPRGPAAARL